MRFVVSLKQKTHQSFNGKSKLIFLNQGNDTIQYNKTSSVKKFENK